MTQKDLPIMALKKKDKYIRELQWGEIVTTNEGER